MHHSAQIQRRKRGQIDRQDFASLSVNTRMIWMNLIDIQRELRLWSQLYCCEAGEKGRLNYGASSLSLLVLSSNVVSVAYLSILHNCVLSPWFLPMFILACVFTEKCRSWVGWLDHASLFRSSIFIHESSITGLVPYSWDSHLFILGTPSFLKCFPRFTTHLTIF